MKFAAIASLFSATAALATPPPHSEWPKYCGTLAMTGTAQSAGNLSPKTAPFFMPLWTATLNGPIASQPTVAGDKVYIGDWSGMESAIDADTGNVVAQIDLGTTTMPQCDPSTLGITSSAAVSNGVVYVAGGNDAFYALDAETLNVLWRRALGDNTPAGGYYGWCSPAVFGARVVQGVSSNCDDPFIPGRVVSLDLFNGEPIDVMWTIDPQGPPHFYSVGGGVWTSPAIDETSHEIFV